MQFVKIFNLHMKPSFPKLSREFMVAEYIFLFLFSYHAYQKRVRKKGLQINIDISSDEGIRLQ